MDDSRVWGPVVTGADVADRVEASLRHWLPGALAETARRRGWTTQDVGPFVQTWDRLSTGDELSRDADLPAVLVSTVDTEYAEAADRVHDAMDAVVVTVAVRGDSHRGTFDRTAVWVAAAELALLQDPTLRAGGDPFSTGLWLAGHAIRPLTADSSRTVLLGTVDLQVLVQGVLQGGRGPVVAPPSPFPEPDPDQPDVSFPDPGEYPLLNTIDVTVTQQEETP